MPVLSLLLGLALVAPAAPSAQAAVPPVSPRTASVVTADALATAQMNGVIWTQKVVGDRIFAGGEFTSARPPGAAPGTGERTRWNLISVSLSTGALNNFAPQFNGPVKALAVSTDGTTLFVAGGFTRVGPYTRNRFAAFRISNGELLTKNPSFNASVEALAVTSSTVYAGGSFTTVDGVSRSRLAAVQAFSGALTAWAPVADNTVRALTVTGDRSKVVAGGSFARINGLISNGLQAVDASSGVRRRWNINTVVKDFGADASILSLAADGDTVYGTGYAFGGGNFEGVFAADDSVGDVHWLQDCHGDTFSVAPVGGVIYSVGHPHFCSNIGGFPEFTPRREQRAMAVTKQALGTVAPNSQPGRSYGDFGGYPAPSIYNWFPALNTGTVTGQFQGAWSVAGTPDYVVLGGEFTTVNGAAQQGLVRFTLPSRSPVRRGAEDRTAATAPTVTAGPGGTARVTWTANWDRDEMTLGYDVLRDGAVVGQVVQRSTFWTRPTLALTDRGLVAGRTYSYQIRVNHRVDPVLSPVVTFTYSGGAAAPDEGSEAQPVHQWRLSGPADSTSVRDLAGQAPLQLSGQASLEGPGAPTSGSGTGLALSGGPEAGASTADPEPATDEVSVELWARTATASGTLAAFGPADAARARELYLDQSGRLVFAVRGAGEDDEVRQVRTDAPFTDDRWHHVVAVHAADALRLYLDGKLVGSAAAPPIADGPGLWLLGGRTSAGQPGAADSGLVGVLDEVAVFGQALSGAEVERRHAGASR